MNHCLSLPYSFKEFIWKANHCGSNCFNDFTCNYFCHKAATITYKKNLNIILGRLLSGKVFAIQG